MWQEIYGISNEELVGVFQYAQENKPEGITYVYNEPFLENPERRKKVLEELRQLNELSPGLIDTIGTQMHIEMTQDTEAIRQCFEDLKDTGVKVQITEFDMCLPERAMFDEKGLESLCGGRSGVPFLARPRTQELFACFNRYRVLQL